MGLIELMFAFVIFAIVALSVAYGLQGVTGTTGQARNRVQATNLAARELELYQEEFRQKFVSDANEETPTDLGPPDSVPNPHPLPGQTAGEDLEIDGLKYNVVRETAWQPSLAKGADACNGGSSATFPVQAVKVTVTWQRQGSAAKVESRTLLTPRQDRVLGKNAFLAMKVIDVNGDPVSDLQVRLLEGVVDTGLSAKTSDTGCVVFVRLGSTPATDYFGQVELPGYTSLQFRQIGQVRLPASPGQITRATLSYDKAMSLKVTLTAPPGYSLPASALPVTLFNSALPGASGRRVYNNFTAGTSTRTLQPLWPTTTGRSYQSWPGACSHSYPAAGPKIAPLVAADGSASVSHVLPGVAFEVRDQFNALVPGVTIRAIPIDNTDCTQDSNIRVGITPTAGPRPVALPPGKWQLQVDGRVPQLPVGVPAVQPDGSATPRFWPELLLTETPATRPFTIRVD